MGRLFGTDGIRGPADGPQFQPELLRRLSSGLNRYLRSRFGNKPLHVMIGRDTRESGEVIAREVASNLSRMGVHVFECGVAPTPAVSKAVMDLGCDLGLVISASHNPWSDNGIKLFNSSGHKFTETEEREIESLIENAGDDHEVLGAATFHYDAVDHYVNYARSLIHEADLDGWCIVVDTANGATIGTTPRVLAELGADVIQIGANAGGRCINEGCGSEHPEGLCESVVSSGAQLGIAHDGDGDRLVVATEKGEVVDGDALLGLIGRFLIARGELPHRTMVATVMSNLGLDAAMAAQGGRVVRAGVGDRQVFYSMKEGGFSFGGESSGHLIFRDILPTGDGLISALQVIRAMHTTGRRLSELAGEISLYPQRLLNLRVKSKPNLDSVPKWGSGYQEIVRSLDQDSRVLVRYSGTEPKIRLLAESSRESKVESLLGELETLARSSLDVVG